MARGGSVPRDPISSSHFNKGWGVTATGESARAREKGKKLKVAEFLSIRKKSVVPINKSTMKSDLGEFPAFLLGRTVVWGLKYRILKNFIQILKISSCQFGKDTRKKNCGRQLDQY